VARGAGRGFDDFRQPARPGANQRPPLLAYSAVANTGYLLVALSANGPKAAAAALFYVVVYGLATLGALAVTAAVERDRGNDRISSFAGLVHRSPCRPCACWFSWPRWPAFRRWPGSSASSRCSAMAMAEIRRRRKSRADLAGRPWRRS
jgi:hypothetical protein